MNMKKEGYNLCTKHVAGAKRSATFLAKREEAPNPLKTVCAEQKATRCKAPTVKTGRGVCRKGVPVKMHPDTYTSGMVTFTCRTCKKYNIFDPYYRDKFDFPKLQPGDPAAARVSVCAGTRVRVEPPQSFNFAGAVTKEGVVALDAES